MKSRKPSAVAARVAQYAVLCLGAFFTLLPFLWMISSSLKTPAEIVRIPPVMIPETAQFSNYAEAWAAAPFGRYLINTVIVTILTTAGVLVTSVLSAFAFSRLKFPGKDLPRRKEKPNDMGISLLPQLHEKVIQVRLD